MFTIGEFARAGGVSARMLRHYDRLGLLRPAMVGHQNGHRYYDAAQLPILQRIHTLKSYGFTLREIGDLLVMRSDALNSELHLQRIRFYNEINRMRKSLRQMENAITEMEGTSLSLDKYSVIVMQNPAQRVYGLRRTIDVGQVEDLFAELLESARQKGYTRTGATQLVYLGDQFDYASMDVEAQVEVDGAGPDIRELPACLCVATTHIGPHESVRHAYDAIREWLVEHPEYEVCGPGMERYLKDHAKDPEELETGVLFPVRKIQ